MFFVLKSLLLTAQANHEKHTKSTGLAPSVMGLRQRVLVLSQRAFELIGRRLIVTLAKPVPARAGSEGPTRGAVGIIPSMPTPLTLELNGESRALDGPLLRPEAGRTDARFKTGFGRSRSVRSGLKIAVSGHLAQERPTSHQIILFGRGCRRDNVPS